MEFVTIDKDPVLEDFVKREARDTELAATIAEIDLRQFEILDELIPGREDVQAQIAALSGIAAARRRRAAELAARVPDGVDLDDVRLEIAQRLNGFERMQVGLEDRLEHVEIYAATPAEIAGPIPPGSAALSAAQIELSAMQGRAGIQAMTEWLDAHSGPIPDDRGDAIRAQAAEVLRRFTDRRSPAKTKKAK